MTISKNHIIIALVAALLIVLLFFTCNKPKPVIEKPLVTVKEIVKVVKADSVSFKKKLDSLQTSEAKLKAKVSEYKTDLKTAQELVVELLNADPTYLLKDSVELLTQIQYLKSAVKVSDSICNATITMQDSVISSTAEQFAASQDFNSKLSQSFNDVAFIGAAKDKEIAYWKKDSKKQKRTKVFYKITTGIVAVVAVALAVK